MEPALPDIRRTSVWSKGCRVTACVGFSALATLCGGCGSPHGVAGNSAASCVGPYLDDQPSSGRFREQSRPLSPGSRITVYGHWYTSTCNDTGGHDPLVPLPPVHLTLVLPGGETKDLGAFQAEGRDMGFSAVVTVPVGTSPGTGLVRDDQPNPVVYEFRIVR